MKDYIEFLKDKMAISHQSGFEVSAEELTPFLYPHVKDTVRWAISGGCRAIFSSFGMQKTVTQLEILRVVLKHKGGKGLIVCPKRVVVEFLTQAEQHLHMKVTYVRTMADVMICPTDIMVTNYERVRDGEDGVRIEPSYFTVTSLDEASVLRGFGTKTAKEFIDKWRKKFRGIDGEPLSKFGIPVMDEKTGIYCAWLPLKNENGYYVSVGSSLLERMLSAKSEQFEIEV